MFKAARILHATDFTECSAPALEAACSLAMAYGAKLFVLHVMPPPAVFSPYPTAVATIPADWVEQAKEDVEKQLQDLPVPDTVDSTYATAVGETDLEVERYCAENDIDLLVVGTHGRGGLRHLLMGSVAERLVRNGPCAVLTVRSQAAD